MRERAPGTWELIVEAGRDPVTGRTRQVSRTFHGNLRDAKKARAELLVEVGKGRHTGTMSTVDQLYDEWIVELRRKGRSPNTVYGYERVYERNIRPTLGKVAVTKVSTKMLTDLYGAHQARGLSARSVYQVHACLSSMFTQACRWGWRDTNPAQWAEPPSIPNVAPVVPTPDEVRRLIAAAEQSQAAGVRPGDPRRRHDRAAAGRAVCAAPTARCRLGPTSAQGVGVDRGPQGRAAAGDPDQEPPRADRWPLDELTLSMLRAQVAMLEQRAVLARVELASGRLRVLRRHPRVRCRGSRTRCRSTSGGFGRGPGLTHVDFHDLRRFMETYGQEMGYSVAQVAMRAGHDPSVAARHYSGRVVETDRDLAEAVASLLSPGAGRK